ncbi:nicotinate (nicotinamide) nucleotide adenylyltransferase [[Mycoplasma] phocae]|uniref:Probable nicotinate-nucleotide adenylyltransferase n=1 Tax=[Mycoplasma] phocae TaxID=142651 RepID=A0A2Z5IQ86_9BACT|nr:nicotinate-nucleotide adenylyltransferase [[Mycoplasma] phocae]AXE60879.1 nicotinate (nicotinamide) nucleotide adenylyltransferase [[Mycoplasma] phocae]
MKIGILGGSFNPVHKGHILVAEDAIKMLNLDKLYFVPNNKNPFKKARDYADNQHRINMLKLVIKDKMEISEFETNRGGNSYTIDTVKYFAKKFPNAELYLLIGSDNVNKLNKWKDIDQISNLVKICVFNRNTNYSKLNIKKYQCMKLNNEFHDFSSTNYRKGNLWQVENEVQKYIGKNFLYFDEIAKNNLSIERYKHLAFTAEFAATLAKENNFPIRLAYQAGYMHDITKEWDLNTSWSFLAKYGFNEGNLPSYKIHQTTAYFWLRDYYQYANELVLNAIKIHTSLAMELNLLDKILFVADKICLGRKWAGVQKLRNQAFIDFEEGFRAVVRANNQWNQEKNVDFTPEQVEINRKWS